MIKSRDQISIFRMQNLFSRPVRIALLRGVASESRIERYLANDPEVSKSIEFVSGLEDLAGADGALIESDATRGFGVDVARFTRICGMLRVPKLVVAIELADESSWSSDEFFAAVRECESLAGSLGISSAKVVPVLLKQGAGAGLHECSVDWYQGPTVGSFLADFAAIDTGDGPLRIVIDEAIVRSESGTRVRGRVASGRPRVGNQVRLVPSGVGATIARVEGTHPDDANVPAGGVVAVSLSDPVGAERGYVMTDPGSPVETADQFEARLFWVSERDLIPGRVYAAKVHSCDAEVQVTDIKYRTETSSDARLAARTLHAGDLAVVNLSLDREVAFEPFEISRVLGSIVIVDRKDGRELGVGTLTYSLRRATNVHWQAIEVTPSARQAIKGHRAQCFWFTGLPSSGKSTIANFLEKRLHSKGFHTYLLDGDNVRHGLNRDLGFSEADRVENVRRVSEVARLMVDAGLVVLVSFISPFRSERLAARKLFKGEGFVEVFVDTPLSVCERRDPKGLYAKARAGSLANFTGIDSPYEPPESPDVRIDTSEVSPEQAAERLAMLALRE